MSLIIDQSVTRAVAVTPSDTVDITLPSGINRTKGLYIGVTGDVNAVMADGSTALFKGLAAGVVHFISVKRINATSTTATNILALY